MEMILKRQQTVGESLMGELFIEGNHMAWTLERVGVQIPAGTYRISLYDSPHFERLMPMLNDVPGREYILIHWGNYPDNSDGCILVGTLRDLSTGDIYSTRQKWDELYPLIGAAVMSEGCSISVLDIAYLTAVD